jgi:hypothetical protein
MVVNMASRPSTVTLVCGAARRSIGSGTCAFTEPAQSSKISIPGRRQGKRKKLESGNRVNLGFMAEHLPYPASSRIVLTVSGHGVSAAAFPEGSIALARLPVNLQVLSMPSQGIVRTTGFDPSPP